MFKAGYARKTGATEGMFKHELILVCGNHYCRQVESQMRSPVGFISPDYSTIVFLG